MDLQQIFDNTDFVHASGTKEEWIVLTAHYDTLLFHMVLMII